MMATRQYDYVPAWEQRRAELDLLERTPTPGQLEDQRIHRRVLNQRFGGVMPKGGSVGRYTCHCMRHSCPWCYEDASLYYKPKNIGSKQR
jgi:hypothetical protein